MKLTPGAFIAFLRKEKGLTQRELSEMLSVSDKTVSHWERDETSPDISLLPVISDIFGITVDELLRGERKEEENTRSEKTEETNNGIVYALDVAFNRFKTKNYISIALSVISILCGCIVDYFKAIDVGYLVFIALLIVPVLLTALFRGSFSSLLVSPYADKALLKEYGKKANRVTLLSLYFSFICFALYSSKAILYAADFVLAFLILTGAGILIYLCEKVMRKKELVQSSGKSVVIRKKNLLKLFSCLLCAIMLFAVYVSHISKDEASIMYDIAEYTLIPAEDFVPFMEKESPSPDELYSKQDGYFEDTSFLPSDKGNEYTFYPDFGADSSTIQILDPDSDGEVTFTYNNLEIARYSYHHEEGFAVYTHSQLIKACAEAERIYGIHRIIHLILYLVAILLSVGIYFIMKRLFLSKTNKDRLVLKLF